MGRLAAVVVGAVVALGPHHSVKPHETVAPPSLMNLLPAKTRKTFICIMKHESNSTPGHYHTNGVEPSSGAAGIFQFVPATWHRYAMDLGIKAPSAAMVPAWVQFKVAAHFYKLNGSFWAWEGDGCV